jgi:hypothetical protein
MTSVLGRSLVALTITFVSTAAVADDAPGKVELGFVPFSLTYVPGNNDYYDDSSTVVRAGGGISFFNTERLLYLQVFATNKLAIEPQLSAVGEFEDYGDFWTLGLSLRANYLFSGADRSSPYVFAGGGFLYMNMPDGRGGEESETDPNVGLGIGFRHPIRTAGSIRVEASWERSFGDRDDTDFLKLALGFALRF